MVWQRKLVSGWGLWKRRSAPPDGPCGSGRTLLFLLLTSNSVSVSVFRNRKDVHILNRSCYFQLFLVYFYSENMSLVANIRLLSCKHVKSMEYSWLYWAQCDINKASVYVNHVFRPTRVRLLRPLAAPGTKRYKYFRDVMDSESDGIRHFSEIRRILKIRSWRI